MASTIHARSTTTRWAGTGDVSPAAAHALRPGCARWQCNSKPSRAKLAMCSSSPPRSIRTSPTTGSPVSITAAVQLIDADHAELLAMNAGDQPMSTAAATVIEPWIPRPESHHDWAELTPQLTATMRRYLVQLTTFLAPRSVACSADSTLRQLARWLTTHTDVTVVADIAEHPHRGLQGVARRVRRHLRDRPSRDTQRQRLRIIRIFLEWLIEWDWPDGRNPILHGDTPPTAPLNPSPSSSPTATPHASWPPPYARPATASSPRCSPAPDPRAGFPNSATSPPTPRHVGDAHWLRVPVEVATASSHSTPISSRSSPSGPQSMPTTSAPSTGSSPTTTHASSDAPSTASSPPSAATPASARRYPRRYRIHRPCTLCSRRC